MEAKTIRRDELQQGDTFHSSHGFDVYVDRVLSRGIRTQVWGHMHHSDGPEWTEAYDRNLPVTVQR